MNRWMRVICNTLISIILMIPQIMDVVKAVSTTLPEKQLVDGSFALCANFNSFISANNVSDINCPSEIIDKIQKKNILLMMNLR